MFSSLPPPFNQTGLPVGLPDFVYATWVAAVGELRNSQNYVQGDKNFQFCCGYIQALQDALVLDERVCRLLKSYLQETWVELLSVLNPRDQRSPAIS